MNSLLLNLYNACCLKVKARIFKDTIIIIKLHLIDRRGCSQHLWRAYKCDMQHVWLCLFALILSAGGSSLSAERWRGSRRELPGGTPHWWWMPVDKWAFSAEWDLLTLRSTMLLFSLSHVCPVPLLEAANQMWFGWIDSRGWTRVCGSLRFMRKMPCGLERSVWLRFF